MTPNQKAQHLAILSSSIFLVASLLSHMNETALFNPPHAYSPLDQDHLQEQVPENQNTQQKNNFRAWRKN